LEILLIQGNLNGFFIYMAKRVTKRRTDTIYSGMARPRKPIRAQKIADGRYRIAFDDAPGWWFNSPYESEKAAIQWGERNKHSLLRRHIKDTRFDRLASGFFDDGSPWNRDQEDRGRTRIPATVRVYQGLVKDHLIPEFGALDVQDMTTKTIDDGIKSARTIINRGGIHKPLARGTRNKLIYALSLMFTFWKTEGLVSQNPLEDLVRYSRDPEKPRSALPRSVLPRLYPDTHGEAVKVWGSPLWIAFFYILNDTGARPGEVRALRWGQVDMARGFIPLRTAIQTGTKDTVKGTKSGAVKPGYISERTIQELEIFRAESKFCDDMDFIFTKNGAPISGTAYMKAFRTALKNTGYEGEGWTPYWLRHSFGTYGLEILDEKELMLLMGHASVITSKIYRHPDDQTVYRQGYAAKVALDKARNDPK
jgi:integrase